MENSASIAKIFRVLDAATNRGREAIRVVEDLIRFVCDDRSTSESLKAFRHDYAILTKKIPPRDRMEFRDTENDVGTTIQGRGEYRRSSFLELATANFCRLQESLRSLEEFSKIVLPEISQAAEQLRYRSYTLERRTFDLLRKSGLLNLERTEDDLFDDSGTNGSDGGNARFCVQNSSSNAAEPRIASLRFRRLKRLTRSTLYVLVDTKISDEQFERLVLSGVDLIQLRDKTATDREIVDRARTLRDVLSKAIRAKADRITIEAESFQTNAIGIQKNGIETNDFDESVRPLLIMNDRPDLAVLADFDGVHVGQDELSVADARRIVGRDRLVGLSTHSLDQVRDAFRQDVDYLGAGPTFPSSTKSFAAFPGLDFLAEISDWMRRPSQENVEKTSQTGNADARRKSALKNDQKNCEENRRINVPETFRENSEKNPVPILNDRVKPIFAIGGVSLDRLDDVLKTGIRRVAVASAISAATDVERTVAEFQKRLKVNFDERNLNEI